MRRVSAVVLSFFLAASVCCSGTASAAVDKVDVLKTVLSQPGWMQAGAFAVNDRGDVVGLYESGGPTRGFLYAGGAYTDIIPPGWSTSRANAISENGKVAGEGSDGTDMGFLYNSGIYTPLIPPGWVNARGQDVNNGGQVVGIGFDGLATKGFLYENGTYNTVMPAGYTTVEKMFISNSGLVAGAGSTGGGRASFLLNGGLMPLGPAGWTDVEVVGINDRDEVAGNGNDGFTTSCFLYSAGGYQAITRPDWFGSRCFALNNNGDVLGWGITGPTSIITFIYRGGTFYEVETQLGYFFALGFNSRYEIVGYAQSLPAGADAVVLSLLPSPDLTAGGKDGPLGAGAAGIAKLKLSMLAWTFKGRRVDWWIVASTPGGPYSYDPFAGAWSPGLTPAAAMPLRDVPPVGFAPAPAAGPGIYTYYFGVDAFANGRIDPAAWFSDILTVVRR